MQKIIIGTLITVILFGIVIGNTYGRVNRKTHALSKLAYLSLYCLLLLIGFLFSKMRVYFFLPVVLVSTPYFLYKYLQLSIRRFHDLDYDGWYLILSSLPIISFYFIYLLYFKEGTKYLNQHDESIDYIKYLKKEKLYPEIGVIQVDQDKYIINGQFFSVLQYANNTVLQCSKTEFDSNLKLRNYFISNFRRVDIPGYANQYLYSFELPTNGLQIIQNNYNAIIIKNNKLLINDIEIFIRKEDFKFALIFDKKNSLPFSTKDFFIKENPYFNHLLVSRKQMSKLIREIRLTTAST